MNLDDIAKKHGVCSLDLSKALEKAGMPQDKSLWYWYEHYNDIKEQNEYFLSRLNPDLIHSIRYPAFNATELADVLPVMIDSSSGDFAQLKIEKKLYGGWAIWYDFNGVDVHYFKADTLPNALAKMVLYLLEKGIIKKEDL